MSHPQQGFIKLTNVFILLSIVAALVVGYKQLPKGFSDDLSVIGQGSIAVVLTHNKNSMNSVEMMATLNNVRSDFEGTVNFLAVDVDTAPGQAFITQHSAHGLVFFNRKGVKATALSDASSEQRIRSTLKSLLSE